MASSMSPELRAALAPAGTLRAAINLGNPILAKRESQGGEPTGVSVDLARALAERLATAIELVVVDKAAQSVEAVRGGRADVGFFAIDPARGEGMRFTAPYVLIEGCYLVPGGSKLQDNAEVDREGVRIAVGSGSAYDLFLTREIKHAQIERVANAEAVFDAVQAGHAEVAAGIRKVLEDAVAARGGLRLLPGRFMVIEQAMGLPADRGDAAADALHAFVEEMKSGGFVASALQRHGIESATVATSAA